MEYNIQDIIDATADGEPVRVQAAFDHLIGQKIMDSLEARKKEIATTMFKSAEVEVEDDTEAHNAENNSNSD